MSITLPPVLLKHWTQLQGELPGAIRVNAELRDSRFNWDTTKPDGSKPGLKSVLRSAVSTITGNKNHVEIPADLDIHEQELFVDFEFDERMTVIREEHRSPRLPLPGLVETLQLAVAEEAVDVEAEEDATDDVSVNADYF